jgi:hypothetical protein
MRALICGVAYQRLAQLWKDYAFRELIREGGDFVVDMITAKRGPCPAQSTAAPEGLHM